MKILAVTACPTGIAHTYMAAEALQKAADKLGLKIKVETQGAMGLENILTARDIASADLVLMACVAVAEERKIRRIKRELKAAELATQSA